VKLTIATVLAALITPLIANAKGKRPQHDPEAVRHRRDRMKPKCLSVPLTTKVESAAITRTIFYSSPRPFVVVEEGVVSVLLLTFDGEVAVRFNLTVPAAIALGDLLIEKAVA